MMQGSNTDGEVEMALTVDFKRVAAKHESQVKIGDGMPKFVLPSSVAIVSGLLH